LAGARTGEELECGTTTLKKYPVKEILVKSKSCLTEHPAQLIKHSLIGENVPKNVLLRILEAAVAGAGKSTLSGKVILLPLGFIAEYGISLVYLLEPFFSLLFVTWIGIRVVFKGKPSESALYFLLAGIFRNAKDLIVVLHNKIMIRLG